MAKQKQNDEVEQRVRLAPFIEIRDAHFEDLFVDYRRIVSVRPPNKDYKGERFAGAVILIEGVRAPMNVDDSPNLILDVIKAAGGGAAFITLDFDDGRSLYVDSRRIVGLKDNTNGDGSTLVYVDGHPNESADGDFSWSYDVTNNYEQILSLIRDVETA